MFCATVLWVSWLVCIYTHQWRAVHFTPRPSAVLHLNLTTPKKKNKKKRANARAIFCQCVRLPTRWHSCVAAQRLPDRGEERAVYDRSATPRVASALASFARTSCFVHAGSRRAAISDFRSACKSRHPFGGYEQRGRSIKCVKRVLVKQFPQGLQARLSLYN